MLRQIMNARRDVRGNRFLPTPIPQDKLDKIFDAALSAPSVGFSQPWEFITITDRAIRQTIADSFNTENDKASAMFDGQKSHQYQQKEFCKVL